MKKVVAGKELLHLLVKVYNRPIHYYHHFPEVIICGQHRLERGDFEWLLAEELLTPYYADSFGKMYSLSAKAEWILLHQIPRKKQKSNRRVTESQSPLLF